MCAVSSSSSSFSSSSSSSSFGPQQDGPQTPHKQRAFAINKRANHEKRERRVTGRGEYKEWGTRSAATRSAGRGGARGLGWGDVAHICFASLCQGLHAPLLLRKTMRQQETTCSSSRCPTTRLFSELPTTTESTLNTSLTRFIF